MFDWLPIGALIENKILCIHGGIGANLNTVEQLENIERPLTINHNVITEEEQLIIDIL